MEKVSTGRSMGKPSLLVSTVGCVALTALFYVNSLVSKAYASERYVQPSTRETFQDSPSANRLCYILVK